MDEAERLLWLKGTPAAFKELAKVLDNPASKNRDKARAMLKRHFAKLRALINDPALAPEDKRALEEIRDRYSTVEKSTQ